jgi:serine/threonine protein kinase/Tol biopolymer transport system component
VPDTSSCPRCGVALLEPEDDSSCPACLLSLALDCNDETRPGTGQSLDPISDHLPTLPPHYRLESRVGSGGMGLVYRAVDTRLNRPVAIKAVHDARLLEPGASARFRAEALAAASLDHPFICKVYELLESGRKALLVMEFVEGETLAGILREGRPPLARTIELISEIAEGLANAHAMGLVHRDIKPSNVMVTPHDHVKLLDFGLARPEVLSEASTTRGTGIDRDARAGTPHYMAPEQAEGKPITARADIFSLGIVAFECIAGELPFDGATEYIYVHALVHDAPKSLAHLAPDTPKELIRLVERCLAKDPSSRPESAAAVAKELRQIAETSVTPTVHTLRAASLQKSRNRWAQIAILSLVATVAIAVGITVWRPWSLGDAQFRQQALVTWPSDERGSAISPDGRQVSFLSYRDAKVGLFVQPTDGSGDATAVTLPAGEILSHLWSPDGTRYACSMRLAGGLFLIVIAAPGGGTPEQRLALPSVDSAVLLRWVGNSVYFQTNDRNADVLRRADLTRQTISEVSKLWKFDDRVLKSPVYRMFDIDPGGTRAVFAARTDDQADLWTANVDGTNLRRLTNDKHIERLPMWTGPETVLYQSARGGQMDLWESSITQGWTRQRTTDWTQEVPESALVDGSVMTFQQVSDNGDLWLADPARPATQLTAEVTTDFAPTVSTDGRTLVFQRSKPESSGGFIEPSTWLMKATLDNGQLTITSVPLETDGSAPLISPDGRRVAFLQDLQPPGTGSKTLKIRHLETGDVTTVSQRSTLPVLGRLHWGSLPMQWTPDGRSLLFVEQLPSESGDRLKRTGYTLKQYVVDSKKTVRLVEVSATQRIRGLFPTADSRSVAYLRWTEKSEKEKERYVVRQVELHSGKDVDLAEVEGAAGIDFQSVSIVGQTAQGSLILLRKLPPAAGRPADEVVEITREGARRSIRTMMNFGRERIAHVDVRRPLLYVVCRNGLVQNVFSVSLETGEMRQVTDNQAPNVSFSGVTSLPNGSLLFARNLHTEDIWLLRRTR